MSYFRSYFEKNNTLIKNSQINTSKSPTTELFYGGGLSKFIFKIDLTELINKLNYGDLVLDNKTKHILNLTNTIIGDSTLVGDQKTNSKLRATSFDLILFKVNEFWDEGVGFDTVRLTDDHTIGNKTYDVRPSNWFKRTNLDPWTQDGVYYDEPTVLRTIHFDNGNENIKLDITDYISTILEGGVDYGIGLGFSINHQNTNLDIDNSVSFFTKYTQTFHEPYLETIFNDRINDNRNDFVTGKLQSLYLTVNDGQNLFDLDSAPIVDILDQNGTITIPNIQSTKITKGIYMIQFEMDNTNIDGRRFYTDNWKGLSIDGNLVGEMEQTFLPKNILTKLNFGVPTKTDEFSFRIVGLKQNEKIKRGELKKVSLHYTTINKKQLKPFENVFYRIYIKEGKTNVTVHDWTQMNKTDENYFMFDSSFYIPREYSIEFKIEHNNEIKHYRDTINFEIISERL